MKRCRTAIMAIIVMLVMSGCVGFSSPEPEAPGVMGNSAERFQMLDTWHDDSINIVYTIYVDSTTGVMYMSIHNTLTEASGITPLYCEDGSLMIYDNF